MTEKCCVSLFVDHLQTTPQPNHHLQLLMRWWRRSNNIFWGFRDWPSHLKLERKSSAGGKHQDCRNRTCKHLLIVLETLYSKKSRTPTLEAQHNLVTLQDHPNSPTKLLTKPPPRTTTNGLGCEERNSEPCRMWKSGPGPKTLTGPF